MPPPLRHGATKRMGWRANGMAGLTLGRVKSCRSFNLYGEANLILTRGRGATAKNQISPRRHGGCTEKPLGKNKSNCKNKKPRREDGESEIILLIRPHSL